MQPARPFSEELTQAEQDLPSADGKIRLQ
jgi:hypothetical protein